MYRFVSLSLVIILLWSSCTLKQQPVQGTSVASQRPTSESIVVTGTALAIASMTSLPCATPAPDQLSNFLKQSITSEDNGKVFVTHVTSRFWIYLDDRIYHLPDLLNAIPNGLIGYVSNGSIRGSQCYPVMFEALKEGKGYLQVKDFQLEILVDNNAIESTIPLP